LLGGKIRGGRHINLIKKRVASSAGIVRLRDVREQKRKAIVKILQRFVIGQEKKRIYDSRQGGKRRTCLVASNPFGRQKSLREKIARVSEITNQEKRKDRSAGRRNLKVGSDSRREKFTRGWRKVRGSCHRRKGGAGRNQATSNSLLEIEGSTKEISKGRGGINIRTPWQLGQNLRKERSDETG